MFIYLINLLLLKYTNLEISSGLDIVILKVFPVVFNIVLIILVTSIKLKL